ncbi:hypothetical protein M2169_006074 [Streptomyces sp. MJP52]|nr:hypothetical protein [Streptomyces sp. MJP52]
MAGPLPAGTVSLRNRLRCRNASDGSRWSMMRSAAGFAAPNNGADRRRVRFVRHYAATRTRSPRGRLQGLPLRTGSAPLRRSAVTRLPDRRGLSPVNGLPRRAPAP